MELFLLSEAIAAPEGRVETTENIAVFLETNAPAPEDISKIVSASAEKATFPDWVLVDAP